MAISQSDFDRLLKGLDTPQQTFLNTYQQSNPLTSNQMESFANAPGAFLSSIGFGETNSVAPKPVSLETNSEQWTNTPVTNTPAITQPATPATQPQPQQPVPHWDYSGRPVVNQNGLSSYWNPNTLQYYHFDQSANNGQGAWVSDKSLQPQDTTPVIYSAGSGFGLPNPVTIGGFGIGGESILNPTLPTGGTQAGGTPTNPSGGGIVGQAGGNLTQNPFFQLFQSVFNQPATSAPFFDFDNSGFIDFADFNQLTSRLGQGQSPFMSGAPSVSNPATQTNIGMDKVTQDLINSYLGYRPPSVGLNDTALNAINSGVGMNTDLANLLASGGVGVNAALQNLLNSGGIGVNQTLQNLLNAGGVGYRGPSSIGYAGPSAIDLTKDLSTMLGVQPGQLGTSLTGLPAGVLAEIQRNPQFAKLLGLTGEGGLLSTGAGSLSQGQTGISNQLTQLLDPSGSLFGQSGLGGLTQGQINISNILSGLTGTGGLLGTGEGSLSQGQMGIGNQLTDILSALGEGGILGQGQTGISAQLAQLLDPTSGIFGQSGFGGIIPTIEELGGLRTAIQTDLSPIQAQLNTLTQQLNQEPDITPQDFISQFWGGFQEILDGLPEGTTVTPGEGGSYTVQPPGDQEAFTFTPPDMSDIPDNRSVYRDAYSDLVLGNTGANNLVGQELVNAISAPNPYAEVEGSVLGEIIRQINQDAETGRKNLENQYAVTNKLDIPLFKEQTQNYEGKVLNDIGNARVNFGLQRAASEESMRRNRLSDLLNFNQTQIGNIGNALQGAIGERSGEIGLQQNIYNQALQNFLNTINQNNAITTAQYGFGDTGLNMGLNALGYATSPSSATAASGIFGQLASQNQGGWNNLIQLLQNPSLYGG